MQRIFVRGNLFLGLAAFLPLFHFLVVVGGLLPYRWNLLIALRNVGDTPILWFTLIHLTIYGVAVYWVAEIIARVIIRGAGRYARSATVAVLLLLSCIGLLPIFGAAHGQIHWLNAYELYASGTLR